MKENQFISNINVKLTENQHEKVKQLASEKGLALATYVRTLIIEAMKKA